MKHLKIFLSILSIIASQTAFSMFQNRKTHSRDCIINIEELKNKQKSLKQLPDEIFLQIFEYMSLKDVEKLCFLNKKRSSRFKTLMKNYLKLFWQNKSKRTAIHLPENFLEEKQKTIKAYRQLINRTKNLEQILNKKCQIYIGKKHMGSFDIYKIRNKYIKVIKERIYLKILLVALSWMPAGSLLCYAIAIGMPPITIATIIFTIFLATCPSDNPISYSLCKWNCNGKAESWCKKYLPTNTTNN